MYYRVFDTENKTYLPAVYNEDTKHGVKTGMKEYLETEATEEDVKQTTSLPWDQYVVKLRSLSYNIEEQITPFDPAEDPIVVDDYFEDYDEDNF